MNNALLSIAEDFGVTEAGLMAGTGPVARRRGRTPAQKAQMVKAAKLLEAAWGGSPYANLAVHEALSTSDLFKSASGDIFDYEMLQQYEAMPTQWGQFSARTTVRDFRPKKLRDLSGGRRKLDLVPELTPYPTTGYAMSERTISVGKYGRRFSYSFEAAINDYLDELQQVPGEFANAARLTEDYYSLSQLANPTTGAPNTGFFTVGNNNLGTGALTSVNLQAAITTVSTKRDADGNLLAPPALILVTGPALGFTAERLLNQTILRVTQATATIQAEEPNPLRGKISQVTLQNLPGAAWFVLPVPSSPRPAFYTAFLRGWETPDLRYKSDQGQRTGGGNIAPEEGSFDIDDVQYRVRHIVGAAQGDPMFTWASDGLGT